MKRTIVSAIVPRQCGATAAPLLRLGEPNRERGIGGNDVAMERTFSGHGATPRAHHPLSLRVSMPRVDAPRLDRIVKASEGAGSSIDCVEPGDFPYAKMTLKYQDSLLQCPLTPVQVPVHWDSPAASIALPASIVDSGAAPSDFALNFVNDLYNRNYV
jgi:hypothetical protein